MSLEEQREEVQRVLDSAQFRRAPKLQRFLEVICEYHFQNRSADINEFVIATEAFGKPAAFDPGHDSLVRVQAREVRRRLREYYQNEGKGSRLVLDIPTGSYVPVFAAAAFPTFPTLPVPPVVHRRMSPSKLAWVMLAVTILACAAILLAADRERRQLVLASSALSVQAAPGAATPLVSGLWDRFTNSGAATVLVLSNPDVGECSGDQTVAAQPAKAPAAATKATPCPDEYTGMGEAVAVHILTNLFQSKKKVLIVKQSRVVTEDDVRRYNLILLGGKKVNVWSRRLGADLRLATEATDVAPAEANPDPAQRFETAFDSKTGQLIGTAR